MGQLNLGIFIFQCSPGVCVMVLPAEWKTSERALCEWNTIIIPLRLSLGIKCVRPSFYTHPAVCSWVSLCINYPTVPISAGGDLLTNVSHYRSVWWELNTERLHLPQTLYAPNNFFCIYTTQTHISVAWSLKYLRRSNQTSQILECNWQLKSQRKQNTVIFILYTLAILCVLFIYNN